MYDCLMTSRLWVAYHILHPLMNFNDTPLLFQRTPPLRTPLILQISHRDASEVPMTVPSQSYMSVEVESSTSSFIHANQQHYHSQSKSPSYTHCESSGSLRQRSTSPRGTLRISLPPHKKRSMDKKPALACLFCRGRKIACGPLVPGSKDRTCK
jgi:hypothetical protein